MTTTTLFFFSRLNLRLINVTKLLIRDFHHMISRRKFILLLLLFKWNIMFCCTDSTVFILYVSSNRLLTNDLQSLLKYHVVLHSPSSQIITQGVSFVVPLRTATLPHGKRPSAKISHDSCCAEGHQKMSSLSFNIHTRHCDLPAFNLRIPSFTGRERCSQGYGGETWGKETIGETKT